MQAQSSIILILVYFGQWPPWLNAFLLSCRANPTIDWLIFTDCETPAKPPSNVSFVPSSRDEIASLAESKLGMTVRIPNNRKLCDIRPAYGVIFSDYIKNYDFWGHCDIDVIWGSIRKFYDKETLHKHDVISSRKSRLAGHFTIFKNIPEINLAYNRHPNVCDLMSNTAYCWFDEKGFSDVIEEMRIKGEIQVLWDAYRLNHVHHVDDFPSLLSWFDSYSWKGGHLYSNSEEGGEIMYLHFMNWKDSLGWCSLTDDPEASCFTLNFCSICVPGEKLSWSYKFKSLWQCFSRPKYFALHGFRKIKRGLTSA